MIKLHRLNGAEVVINAELIEAIEAHGIETVIIMATNNRIVVQEQVDDVVARACEYRRRVGPVPVPSPLRCKEQNVHGGAPCR